MIQNEDVIQALIDGSDCTGYVTTNITGITVHHDGATCPVHEAQTTEGGAVVFLTFPAIISVGVNIADGNVEVAEYQVLDASEPQSDENDDRTDAAVTILQAAGWSWASELGIEHVKVHDTYGTP